MAVSMSKSIFVVAALFLVILVLQLHAEPNPAILKGPPGLEIPTEKAKKPLESGGSQAPGKSSEKKNDAEVKSSQRVDSNLGAKNIKETPKAAVNATKAKVPTVIVFGSSPGAENVKNNQANGTVKKDASSTKKKVRATPQSPQSHDNSTATDPLDFLQISDPTMKSTVNALYGSFSGNSDCTKKSLCLAGNYFQELPGRDFIFMLIGQYIPKDWNLLFEIFRVSVLYGQNCESYICVVNQRNGLPR